jgi:lysozyme
MPKPPINAAGLKLVKEFEGYRDKAYICPTGHWTIGWGHTKGVKRGMRCTPEQAEAWLLEDLQEASDAVDKYVVVPLTPNQRAAITSLIFNLRNGPEQFRTSTIRRLINRELFNEAQAQFARWNKGVVDGKKVEIAGLTRRRAAEAALWGKK